MKSCDSNNNITNIIFCLSNQRGRSGTWGRRGRGSRCKVPL
uniref:Uncharacterized protein n=1 Tax=Anguilla anguilla TaxID=7936 RepID=A0A0E9QZV0_ANGAN